MKHYRSRMFVKVIAVIAFAAVIPFVSETNSVSAQGGNTISGQVFGVNRTPIYDVTVELLDDLNRALSRVKTTSSGRYFFSRLSAGRFTVRVVTFGAEYEDQEQSVEIINFTRGTGSGDNRISGITNEQKDFYLKPKKDFALGAAAAVFAQEVPPEAKKLYEAAVVDLENKKINEAYAGLKSSIEVFPKYFAALELLGGEYVKAGHYEAAQILLAIAVSVNPRGYKSWHGLGYALYAQKQYSEALTAAEKAIELNARIPEPVFLSGTLLRLLKRFEDSEKQLIRARDLSSDSLPEVHWELALVYGNGLKRYREAARELKLFLKARPDVKDAENIKKIIADFEQKSRED